MTVGNLGNRSKGPGFMTSWCRAMVQHVFVGVRKFRSNQISEPAPLPPLNSNTGSSKYMVARAQLIVRTISRALCKRVNFGWPVRRPEIG